MFEAQLALQPGSCESGVAHDGYGGDIQHLGGLFHAETTEESKLDYPSSARVYRRQGIERIVNGNQIASALPRDIRYFIQIDVGLVTTPLRGGSSTGGIEQDVPHDARRYGEKVCAMLPVHVRHVDEAQIGLMYQGSSLNGAARFLILHETSRQTAEFAVNARGELIESSRLASRPGAEKFRGFRCFDVSHGTQVARIIFRLLRAPQNNQTEMIASSRGFRL